jgi:hypothetical protein
VTPRRFLAALALAAALAVPPTASAVDEHILRVPGDYSALDAAIAASTSGDVILLAAGTYPGGVTVPEDKPGITIRGVNRNTVVFDGERNRHNAIEVEADQVSLENLSAHDFVENGFYWDGVVGFAGRYLTVWNVGLYAIYAIQSRSGVIEQSYASGAGDAAFYIGECYPCDTVVRNVTAKLSAVGYSGTNAGGSLIVEDSVFEANEIGILPNSYDVGLQQPPQREATFRRNVVRGTGTAATPRDTPLAGFHGVGIGIIGGVGNVIEGNEVTGSGRYGIVVVPAVDRQTTWVPSNNRISANKVSGSVVADLAVAAGSGPGNCFEGNTGSIVDPADLAAACSTTGGSDAVAAELAQAPPVMLEGLPSAPPYASMPAPGEQPTLPGADDGGFSWLAIPAVLLALGIAGLLLVFRRRRERDLVSPSRG